MRVSSFVASVLLGGALIAGQAAEAASIGLGLSYPDLRLTGGSLTYTYTAMCQRANGMTGTCGPSFTIPRWDLTTGVLLVSGSSLTFDPDGSGFQNVTGTRSLNFRADFGFNSDGTALVLKIANDTPDDLRITGNTSVSGYAGPNLVTGEIADARTMPYLKSYAFGYSGTDRSGSFEFIINSLTGNYSQVASTGRVIISTTNLTHTLLPAGGNATWDSKGIGFWKNNFSATATVDAVVPVPGAAWMLLSALAGLSGLRRYERLRSPSDQALRLSH